MEDSRFKVSTKASRATHRMRTKNMQCNSQKRKTQDGGVLLVICQEDWKHVGSLSCGISAEVLKEV